MGEPLRIAVSGAGGRLGRSIMEVIAADRGFACVATLGRAGAHDPAGEPLAALEAVRRAQVLVDVSTPQAAAAAAALCVEAGTPLVLGVTGLGEAEQAAVDAAAGRIPVLQSGNFSIGVNLLLALVRDAARALGPAYDIEIHETHHRRKIDAPSGTALMLGRAAAQGRGVELAAAAVGLDGDRAGHRPQGAIGFSVSRGGGVVGEHAVGFLGEREVVTLRHSARDRSLFADGALAAARWIVGRPPGLYGMEEVIAAERGS